MFTLRPLTLMPQPARAQSARLGFGMAKQGLRVPRDILRALLGNGARTLQPGAARRAGRRKRP